MATATAEPRSLPTTEGNGHKHKKNALSDGQGRLAWILLGGFITREQLGQALSRRSGGRLELDP